jgi:sporulation protein YlmC with PRC-barrel domain
MPMQRLHHKKIYSSACHSIGSIDEVQFNESKPIQVEIEKIRPKTPFIARFGMKLKKYPL